ncbi:MAG TPA: hypothetical protein PL041_08320, partial [Melioribacteraceae bacterium]|nr:hypothetical protein [Melioribacteraceae bacterium]
VLDFINSTPQVKRILEYCISPKLRNEIQLFIGLSDRKYFSKVFLAPLINFNLVEMTMPEKPKSSKQKYTTSNLGKQILKDILIL